MSEINNSENYKEQLYRTVFSQMFMQELAQLEAVKTHDRRMQRLERILPVETNWTEVLHATAGVNVAKLHIHPLKLL